jgi:D-lactate dehydrogenase
MASLISDVPDYGDSTVAEHVFALLLAVARNLLEAVERTR